ncbi:sulfatase-like hydrolase/transferase [Lutibacter citreus]|uniref:sulfatase-like hydrolase/transferase n=1 Tax=Lutibacter citreus TaxID=2138210 RepID=UPI000DBE500D|nr:sulfatase-like hydrolase/transferase [Lutibacter citreus]
MFKYIQFILIFAISFSVLAQKNKKPNIILIYADDISARELPIYKSDTWSPPEGGNTQDMQFRAKTPVLDNLANEGVYIKTAWAAVVCSPSRAMMMTGRYAHIHKWWANSDIGRYSVGKKKTATFPLFKSSPKLIGHIAQEGGYKTFWVGKTQMRNDDLDQYGFEEGVFTAGSTTLAGVNPYTNFEVEQVKKDGKKFVINKDSGKEVVMYPQSSWYWKPHVMLMNHPTSSKKYEWWPNTAKSKKEYGVNTFGPDVELDFAFDFMERKVKKDEPFFLYHTSHLGHDAFDFLNPTEKNKWPGTPIVTYKNGKYKRTDPKIKGSNGKYNLNGTVTKPGIHNHLNYLDYQVSLYLEKMKELKIEDNTILVFCADNGTSGYGKNSNAVQKGVHVPFIVYAPGFNFTKKGEQDILLNISDVLPTITEIVGVEIPEDYEINGESFWPYLTTDKKEHRKWIYAYKSGTQLIRGKKVLKDGTNKWFDVSETPSDLISFNQIKDWKTVSEDLKKEKNELTKILPRFDLFATAPNGPLEPGAVLPKKKEKSWVKKKKKKKH